MRRQAGAANRRQKFAAEAAGYHSGAQREKATQPEQGTLNSQAPKARQKNHDDEGVLRGIPKPPSSAASGCLEAGFWGAAGTSSSSFFDEGDGTYGLRKKSSMGGCA